MASRDLTLPARNPWCSLGLGHSMQARPTLSSAGPHLPPAMARTAKKIPGLKPADLPVSHVWDGPRERNDSPHCDRANYRARTQANPGPLYPNNRGPTGQSGLNVTLVSDSFPRKRKPPLRIAPTGRDVSSVNSALLILTNY